MRNLCLSFVCGGGLLLYPVFDYSRDTPHALTDTPRLSPPAPLLFLCVTARRDELAASIQGAADNSGGGGGGGGAWGGGAWGGETGTLEGPPATPTMGLPAILGLTGIFTGASPPAPQQPPRPDPASTASPGLFGLFSP